MSTPTDPATAALIALIVERGEGLYHDVAPKGDAGICGIARFLFTHAILADMEPLGYARRWCYHDYAAAKAALDAWDGAAGTEPQGWHKDPMTGRRRAPDGSETVDP
jgi:hypothetical protein